MKYDPLDYPRGFNPELYELEIPDKMRKNNLAYHLSEVNKFAAYIDHQKLIVGIPQSDEIYRWAQRSVSLKFLKKIGYNVQIVIK